jgi:mono/diheme cytochrome c family protein
LHMRLYAPLFFALAVLANQAHAEDAVSRGSYLAVLGDCAGCHTKAHGPAFSGGLPFQAQFGTVYSTNITPDKQTGIGSWTEDQFYRAVHDGIAADGHHLYPALPYVYFSRLTRHDTDDLFAFLHSVKPVRQAPTPNELIFPFNIRAELIFWNWLYLPKSPPKIDPAAPAEWKRGEYIVNGLGHCAACHTPKDILFGDLTSKALTGGAVANWFAADLTGNVRTGLGKWTAGDIVHFLATGRNQYATAAGTMEEKITSSTSHMTPADLHAIATYLKTLAPRTPVQFQNPRPEQMERGRGVYLAHCQECHAADGEPRGPGARGRYPNLAGDTLVMGRDPTTVLRIILTGGTAPPVKGKPAIKPMPDFAKLNDGMIADVSTYIRNAWGNSAPLVSATRVHWLRRALSQ